jgi:hypothetical protein
MGDHLKKVKSGDPLVIPASTFNAFIDAAQAHQAQQRALGAEGMRDFGHAATVRVRNDSGAAVDRFGVLGIDGPVIGPDANLVEFQGRPTLKGVTPIAGAHDGKFVVLLDPIGNGRIGRACAAGLTVARIDVSDAVHGYADIDNGDASHLASASSGAAKILWKESGTGEKWALVSIGEGAGSEGGPTLTFIFYADLISYSEGMLWSSGNENPQAADETKQCWNELAGDSYYPVPFWWVPVRAGTVRRVSAYMTNRLAAGNEISVEVLWRQSGSPCPLEDVNSLATVTLSNAANIAHSGQLSQSLGDDYLLGVRLKAGAVGQVAGKQVTGNGQLLSGSVNGDYRPGGTYNGQTYYVRVDGGYTIFYRSSSSQWRIAAALGNDYAYFYKTGGVDGTYTPGPHCTGNPVVAPATVSWWSYVNPSYEERPVLVAAVEYRTG